MNMDETLEALKQLAARRVSAYVLGDDVAIVSEFRADPENEYLRKEVTMLVEELNEDADANDVVAERFLAAIRLILAEESA